MKKVNKEKRKALKKIAYAVPSLLILGSLSKTKVDAHGSDIHWPPTPPNPRR
jgi:hypothetical protein